MILHVDSDAAYLVAPKARSLIAGFYYLSTLRSEDTPPLSTAASMSSAKPCDMWSHRLRRLKLLVFFIMHKWQYPFVVYFGH